MEDIKKLEKYQNTLIELIKVFEKQQQTGFLTAEEYIIEILKIVNQLKYDNDVKK